MSKILITGCRTVISLDVARNLYKNGNIIYALETIDFNLCKYSNCIKECFQTKSVRFHEKEYIDYVIFLIKNHDIDILMPFGEEGFYLAKNKSKILKECPKVLIYCENIEKIDLLHNKLSFYKLVKDLNINIPRTQKITSKREVVDYVKSNDRKVVLKPIYSRFASNIIIVDEYTLHLVEKVNFNNMEWLMQDYIDGKCFCTYSVHNKGKTSLFVPYESEYVIKIGPMVNLRTATKYSKDIKRYVDKIANHLKYHGQLGFDFIIDNNNNIYMLECNPRITSGITLVTKEYSVYDILFCNKQIDKIKPCKTKSWGFMVTYFVLGYAKLKDIFKILKVFFTYRDMIFSIRDFKPYILGTRDMLKMYFKYGKKIGDNYENGLSYDMQYNGGSYEVQD